MLAITLAWNFLGTNTTTPGPPRHRDEASQRPGTHRRPHSRPPPSAPRPTRELAAPEPDEGRRVTLSGCAGPAHSVEERPRPRRRGRDPAPVRGPAAVLDPAAAPAGR